MPSKRKKMRQENQKMRGGGKAKSKSQDCCVTFKPKNYLELLLSVHARTSQANILHLDEKVTKCSTCKRLCGTFSTSFKTHFSAKSPRANGLRTRARASIHMKGL